jgi:hypothetical protein
MQPDLGIERLLKVLEKRTNSLREALEKFYKVDEILGGDILISNCNTYRSNIVIMWKHRKNQKLMNTINKFLRDNLIYDEVKKEKTFYEFHWEGKRYLHKVKVSGAGNKNRNEYPALGCIDTLRVLNILEQFKINPIEN